MAAMLEAIQRRMLGEGSQAPVADLKRARGVGMALAGFEQLTGRKATSFDHFARDYGSAFQQDARAAS